MVRLDGLGKMKEFNDLIGTRTRDLPACSTVPQQTMLQRAPQNKVEKEKERDGENYKKVKEKQENGRNRPFKLNYFQIIWT
jgi:hypothetical protein